MSYLYYVPTSGSGEWDSSIAILFVMTVHDKKKEREINKHMHKTIGKLRILYSNYNTQETNQKPKSSEKETKWTTHWGWGK